MQNFLVKNMADEIGKEERINRICYVEPNDVFGSINGSPITPPYEDFSISFDLIVKVMSRLRSNSVNGNAGVDEEGNPKWIISWTSTPKDTTPSWVTFMSGNDVGNGTNSLTTDYTNISFDQYFKGEQIEGLGVEQVSISFESWYTPTVSIKFVDVRGSAFFGREEAIHYDDKITADNLFGCFATVPYPEFKLQIKGFLGRPVTYQLACSGIHAELNPQNGNFEFNVNFIGYSYALLTDIPFDYLIASPLNPYVGVSYWNQHKNSPEWAMLGRDGKPEREPVPLDDFFRQVENAQKEYSEEIKSISDGTNEVLSSAEQEKNLLNNIIATFMTFRGALVTDVQGKFIDITNKDDRKRQIVLFSKSEKIKLTTANIRYKEFVDAINTYNDAFGTTMITTDKLPNGWEKECPLEVVSHDSFIINTNDKGVYSSITYKDLNGREKTYDNIKALKFNDDKTLTDDSVRTLLGKTTSIPLGKEIQQYVYIIDCNNLIDDIATKIENLALSIKKKQKEIRQKIDDDITSILPFRPYIGNVFKLIFCHLETFCHIMYEASKDIQSEASNNLRTPSVLNIDLGKTDFYGNIDNVPAWVGVVNSGSVSTDGGDIDTEAEIFGLPSDFSDKFIEMQVVEGFEMAIQTIQDKRDSEDTESTTITNFPITTCDFNNNGSIFNGIENITLSELSGYLSIRAAQLFGILMKNAKNDLKTVTLLGSLDACNYYKSVAGIGLIKGNIFNVLGSNNIVDVIEGISECNPIYDSYGVTSSRSGKTRHKFETVLKIDGISDDRHPFFKDGKYVHYYNKEGVSLVPSELKKYELYSRLYNYEVEGSKPYFTPSYQNNANKNDEIKKTLYKTDTIRIKSKNDTFSTDMFNIFVDSSYVNGMTDRYSQLNEGNVKVLNYEVTDNEGLKAFIGKFWKIDNERYSKFFGVSNMLSPKLDKIGVDTKNLILSNNPSLDNEEKRKTNPDFIGWRNLKNTVELQSDGTWKASINGAESSEISFDETVIQDCKLYIKNNNANYDYVNLFGSPFYYLQNSIKDEDIRLKVKALLYLHTLRYNYSQILNVFDKNKTNGCIECVPYGYLLLIGGLLWRRKNGENIVYTDKKVDYYPVDKNKTLFVRTNNEYYFTVTNKTLATSDTYNVSLASLLGGNDIIDSNIEYQLISLFEDFVKNIFPKIKDGCEITNRQKGKDNKVIGNLNYTPSTLIDDIKAWYDIWTNKDTTYSKMSIHDKMQHMRDKFCDFTNGNKVKYRMFAVMNGNILNGFNMLLNEDDIELQGILKDVYYHKCLISDANARIMGNNMKDTANDKIEVPKEVFRSYVKGFTDTLSNIVENTTATISDSDSTEEDEESKTNRNLCMGIYYYLKNVWDKWLIGRPENTYDVSTFFKNNFIFMDSFYRNTFYKLPINCERLIECYKGKADEKSLYSFVGDLCKAHQCWFMAVPDFIHFTGEDTVDGHNKEGMYSDIEKMKDVFRPLPYNEIPPPENSNKFVIIYTSKPSEVPSNVNNFKCDSFDIWSHTDGFDNLPAIFKSDRLIEESDASITRLGYKVPSFGVSFARQNQHLFKNIRVNMNNPIDTEQSIKTYHHLISKGKSGERKICFTGQDVFNIYSNYSYECEVEMIGDAQICPLMYFQLLNVPMWRGAYMIYKVTHTMTPGNMTTTFRGMKMCKYPKPFSDSFFVRIIEGDTRSNEYNDNSNSGSEDGYLESSYKKVNSFSKDWYHDPDTGNAAKVAGLGIDKGEGKTVNPQIVRLFNLLYEEIAQLPENQPKMTWNVVLSHVLRSGSGKSAHYKGNAMDLKVAHYNNGIVVKEVPRASGETNQKELIKAADILASLHLEEIDQLILEYEKYGDMCSSRSDFYNCLHVGVLNNEKKKRHQCFIGAGAPEYHNVTKKLGASFLTKVPPLFDYIAKKAYQSNKDNFTNRFINYAGFESKLDEHFGKSDGSAFERWLQWNVQIEGGPKNNGATKHGYGIEQQAWSDYQKATGDEGHNYRKFYRWSWNKSKAANIKDDAVAILYARAYFFIPGVAAKISPSSLNNLKPREAFNKVIKLIADYMFKKKDKNEKEYVFGDKGHGGWRKFLWYTRYNKFINYNNEADVSEEKVKEYIKSL